MTETELRKLNEKVAQRLGWTRDDGRYLGIRYRQGNMYTPDLPNYTGSIADAWEIIENWPGFVGIDRAAELSGGYKCIYWEGHARSEWAPTAPLAICRAFSALEESK